MTTIRIRPLTQWAKNKAHQHGDEFEFMRTLGNRVLIRSLGKTWKGANGPETWMGWLEVGKDVPACEKCSGAGWLRGYELSRADEATRADSMTKYTCDQCKGSCVDPGDDE